MARRTTDLAKAAQTVMEALSTCEHVGDEDLRVTIEVVEPTDEVMEKADPVVDRVLKQQTPILKTSEERYVLGIVLEPLKELGRTDSQNDLYSAEEVRKAAYRFMEDYGGTFGLQHRVKVDDRVKLLENWITRSDEEIGGQMVKAGTWLIGVRVTDDALWARVKDGTLTGFSIGGYAQRAPVVSN